VVHCAGVRGAPVREWCTFFKGRFSSVFKRELPCESGAIRKSSQGSRARVGHFFEERFSSFFERELPCENGALRGSSRGSRARVVHLFLREVFERFQKGAPIIFPCAEGTLQVGGE
jgi:hypothetical protein